MCSTTLIAYAQWWRAHVCHCMQSTLAKIRVTYIYTQDTTLVSLQTSETHCNDPFEPMFPDVCSLYHMRCMIDEFFFVCKDQCLLAMTS